MGRLLRVFDHTEWNLDYLLEEDGGIPDWVCRVIVKFADRDESIVRDFLEKYDKNWNLYAQMRAFCFIEQCMESADEYEQVRFLIKNPRAPYH